MPEIQPWFERKFEFSFPVEQYPNLLVRLRGTPPRVEEMLRGARPEALIRNPAAYKWSAQEHTGHLWDLEALWLARVNDFLGPGTELTVADLKNRKTHEAIHNARAIDEILSEFRSARLLLVNCLEELTPEMFSR